MHNLLIVIFFLFITFFLFADESINIDDTIIIDEILVNGNELISSYKVLKELTVKKDDIVDSQLIQLNLEHIKKIYEKNKYQLKDVQYHLEQDTELRAKNSVRLIFEINEAPVQYIDKIIFQGNQIFKDNVLEIQMNNWAKKVFGVPINHYHPADFTKDIEKIKQYYLNHGYIDVQINDTEITVLEKREDKNSEYIQILIKIEEGKQYYFNGYQFLGNDTFQTEELLSLMRLKKYKIFNHKYFSKDMEYIKYLYTRQGIPITQLVRNAVRDDQSLFIGYEININEIGKSYIEAIRFEGDYKIKDYLLLKKLSTEVGQLFYYRDLDHSITALEDLDVINKVEYQILPGSAPGLIIIQYTVTPYTSIEWYFELFYDTSPQILFNLGTAVKMKHYNLFNRLINMENLVRGSILQQYYGIEVNDPYFLNSPFSFGAGISLEHRWEQLILREVGQEVNDFADISSEQALRKYYTEEANGMIRLNKNYLGYEMGEWGMGIHQILLDFHAQSHYHFLKYFSVGVDYHLIPFYNFISSLPAGASKDDQINKIDDSIEYLKEYLRSGWVLKSKLSAPFIFDTTKKKYFLQKVYVFILLRAISGDTLMLLFSIHN